MGSESAAALRALPKIDELLRRAEIVAAVDVPRWALVEAARREVERKRKAILAGADGEGDVDVTAIVRLARELARPSLRRVINATGVVLHTNFGRAPLAAAAIERVVEVARGYSNLEYEVDERERGSRHAHVRAALRELTGAEDAVVVNNCASAVLLALAAMAAGREVVVSRGELVEIGGAFRVPDVMRVSGARLVEVGTTNKTHRKDYEGAIGGETGLLLKVHRSNFAVIGFTAEVEVGELVEIGRTRGVPVMVDLGSGALVDLAAVSGGVLPREPTVQETVAAGAALVAFSGDKLLGGPQAGVIVGDAVSIARVKAHPLMRAVRPDKLTLAALEGTLAIYRRGPAAAVAEVPALRMLCVGEGELRERADRLAAMIGAGGGGVQVVVAATTSAVGGGALPLAEPASWAITVHGGARSPEQLDQALRAADPPVVGKIAEDRLWLDVRTIAEDELAAVARAVQSLS